MIAQLLPANVFAALLIFARVGAALMLLPGFGEFYVPQRYRLLLALLLAGLLTPVLADTLPRMPASPLRLAVILGGEVMIGVFIGSVARMLLAALDVVGTVVSFQLGLSAATIFNPMLAQQGTITGTLYSLLGVLLIFLTDLHHTMLRAVVDSYAVFTPGALPAIGDLSDVVARVAASSFRLAIEMSAPFIVLGTVFFVALGLMGRLVPQLQLLFVMQPLQIVGGLAIFVFVLVSGMRWFLDAFAQHIGALTAS